MCLGRETARSGRLIDRPPDPTRTTNRYHNRCKQHVYDWYLSCAIWSVFILTNPACLSVSLLLLFSLVCFFRFLIFRFSDSEIKLIIVLDASIYFSFRFFLLIALTTSLKSEIKITRGVEEKKEKKRKAVTEFNLRFIVVQLKNQCELNSLQWQGRAVSNRRLILENTCLSMLSYITNRM